jgi:creatinine amidohydrolase/Fe(II)-dependent formamide hydrolase-like protein
VNEEVAESLVRTGFRYIIILMGDHGGNQPPLKALAPKLDEKYRPKGVRVFFSGDAYAKSDAEIAAWLKEHGYPDSNHGGIADTSEVWAADPRSVRPGKIAMGDPIQRTAGGAVIGPSGVEGDPRPSSVRVRAWNGPLGFGGNPDRASARYPGRRGGSLPGISSPTGSACRSLHEPRKSGTGRSDLLPSACRPSWDSDPDSSGFELRHFDFGPVYT